MTGPFCPTHQVRMTEVEDAEARGRGMLYECPEGGYECYERGKHAAFIPPEPPAEIKSASSSESKTSVSDAPKSSDGVKFRKVRTPRGTITIGPKPRVPYSWGE